MNRETRLHPHSLEIHHTFGAHDRHGDIIFDATGSEETFDLWTDRCTGLDRDNYSSSDETEIHLNEDEARELHLALTIWLEART